MAQKNSGSTNAVSNSEFSQFNIEELKGMIKVVEVPLAVKIYYIIIQKMNHKNALIASNHFFENYFQCSKSSVRRAVQVLEEANILRVKRRYGLAIYLTERKCEDISNPYFELESNVLFTNAEWSGNDGRYKEG